MENLMDKIVEWGAFYGTRVIGALVILIIGRLLAGEYPRNRDDVTSRPKLADCWKPVLPSSWI